MFFCFFLKKQVDRIEKGKLVLVYQEKLAVKCFFFLNKKKTDRYNIIIIESARVRGSNKDGRGVFLAVS